MTISHIRSAAGGGGTMVIGGSLYASGFTGILAGDLILAAVHWGGAGVITGSNPIPTVIDWDMGDPDLVNVIASDTGGPYGSGSQVLGNTTIVLGVAEGGETQFGIAVANNPGNMPAASIQVSVFRGVGYAEVLDYAFGTNHGSTWNIPSVTPGVSGEDVLLWAPAFLNPNYGPTTTSSGWTQAGLYTGLNPRNSSYTLYQVVSSPSGSYAGTLAGAGGETDTMGWNVALRAAPAPPDPTVVVEVDGVVMEGLIEKQCRIALNDPGSFSFRIPKGHAQATQAILRRGAIVEFTFPEIHPDPLFEGLLETGDFDLISTQEEGGEELAFGGPGSLGILDRAKMYFQAVLDTPSDPASVVKLSEGVWRWVNQEPGDILERIIKEAQTRGPLAMIDYTWTEIHDSDGVHWANPGPWSESIGASVLDAALRLVAAGQLNLVMRPGLVLDAFQTIGTDRSSSSFAAGKVRFAKSVNIVDEVGRSMAGRAEASHALVHGDNGRWIEVVRPGWDADTDLYIEIVVEVNSHETSTMQDAGYQALEARQNAQEAIIFGTRVPYPGEETDELSGIYLPGPTWSERGQYWPGDIITLHTGTGDFEYDNEPMRIYAITLREDEIGHLAPPIVELNSPWIDPDDDSPASDDAVPASGGGTGGGGSGSGSATSHVHGQYQVGDTDKWKQPVRVATTANITISTGLNAGDTIDGVTLAAGDRVLVKDQTDPTENGIYQAGAAPTRASDFDASEEVAGAVVLVLEGTANEGLTFRCENTTEPVIDTDAITFTGTGGGFTGDAGDVPITDPGGHFTSTDVEGALDELGDTDATLAANDIALAAATSAHLADTSDAHDASAISILDAGSHFTATDVEAALAELYAAISAASGDVSGQVIIGFDGGGSAIVAGKQQDVILPFSGTPTAWTLIGDTTGSAVVDLWVDTYGNYPPTIADTITASAKPTVSSSTKATGSPTGWSGLTAGRTLRANLDSCSGFTRLLLVVAYSRP